MKNPLRVFLSLCLECCYLLLVFFFGEIKNCRGSLMIYVYMHVFMYVILYMYVIVVLFLSVVNMHIFGLFLSESSTNKWAIFFLIPNFLEDAEWPYSLLSTASFSLSKASFCMYYVGKFAHKNEWDLLYEKD